MEIQSIFTFASLIEKMKKMERYKGQFYWKDYPQLQRYESVADHTWRLSILVLLFEKELSQKINIEKALKMALVHDLPEIEAGDESPLGSDGTGKSSHAFNDSVATQRHEKEKNAARKLFGTLPEKQAEELFGLWLEFEKQESFESRVIKSLDKIEACLQVLEYRQGHMFPKHLEFTTTYGVKGSDVDPAIDKFAKLVIGEIKNRFKPFEK